LNSQHVRQAASIVGIRCRFSSLTHALLWRLRCMVRGREADIPVSSAFPADAADRRFQGRYFYDTQLSKRYGQNDHHPGQSARAGPW
jgi:hypothetical protein